MHLPAEFSHLLIVPITKIDLLRASAGYLLMNSEEFIAGVRGLGPDWKPRQITLSPGLIDEVCGPGSATGSQTSAEKS